MTEGCVAHIRGPLTYRREREHEQKRSMAVPSCDVPRVRGGEGGGVHGSNCGQQARQVISLYNSSQLLVSCGCQTLPTRYISLAV